MLLQEKQVTIFEPYINKRIVFDLDTNISNKEVFFTHISEITQLNSSIITTISGIDDLERASLTNNLNRFKIMAESIIKQFQQISSLSKNNLGKYAGDCTIDILPVQPPIIELVTTSAAVAKLKIGKITDHSSFREADETLENLHFQLNTIAENSTIFLNLATSLTHNFKSSAVFAAIRNSKCISNKNKFFINYSSCTTQKSFLQCLVDIQLVKPNGKVKKLIAIPNNNKSFCHKSIYQRNSEFILSKCFPPGRSCSLETISKKEQNCFKSIFINPTSSIQDCKICSATYPFLQTEVGLIVQGNFLFRSFEETNTTKSTQNMFEMISIKSKSYLLNTTNFIPINKSSLIKSKFHFSIKLLNSIYNFSANSNVSIIEQSAITAEQIKELTSIFTNEEDTIDYLLYEYEIYLLPTLAALTFLTILLIIKTSTNTCLRRNRIRRLRRQQRKVAVEEPAENLVAFLDGNSRQPKAVKFFKPIMKK